MNAVTQFTEMIREHYFVIQIGKLERQEILLNITEAEMNKEITKEQADELRKQYQQGNLS